MMNSKRPMSVLAGLGLSLALVVGGAPAGVAVPAVPAAQAGVPVQVASAVVPGVQGAVAGTGTVRLAEATPGALRLPAAPRIERRPNHAGVLVNKQYPVSPRTYVPYLRKVSGTSFRLHPNVATAFEKMRAAAKRDGVALRPTSAYRSYQVQQSLMANYTRWYGKAYAQRVVAPAGTSEHQTGLAVDVSTAGGASSWLARNGHKWGFILRYPKGQEKATGYSYEPWHFTYVGTKIAGSMKSKKTPTLEHYYGVAGQKAAASPSKAATKTTTANLRMRSGAGTGHRVLVVVPEGKKVSLTGKRSGAWYQVKYGTRTGWMSGAYLR